MSPLGTSLATLLQRAGISQYQGGVWFHSTALHGSRLDVPDAQLAVSLERCFGVQLRAVLPSFQILVVPPPTPAHAAPSYLNRAGQVAWRQAYPTQALLPDGG